MDRRMFLKTAMAGSLVAGFAGTAAATSYFPTQVDLTLFNGINRVKDPTKKSGLEKSHAPVIVVPESVKGGEIFSVEVTVGESLHPMGPSHWIQFIELSIGNEPAGRIDFQSRGFMKPKVVFNISIPKDAAPAGKVTLLARQHCNLHGLWEEKIDISVS